MKEIELAKEAIEMNLGTWELTQHIYSLITTIESQQRDNQRIESENKGYLHSLKLKRDEIESQKEEIAEVNSNRSETIANFNKIKNEYFSNKREIESLKAITELAVKGLKEVLYFSKTGTNSFESANSTLSEIERLQNG